MWLRPGAPSLLDGLVPVAIPAFIGDAADAIDLGGADGLSVAVYASPDVADCTVALRDCSADTDSPELHRAAVDLDSGLILHYESVEDGVPGATFRITSILFGVG